MCTRWFWGTELSFIEQTAPVDPNSSAKGRKVLLTCNVCQLKRNLQCAKTLLDNSKVKSKAVMSHPMLRFLTQLKESLDFIIQGFDFLRQRFYLLEEISDCKY